MDRKFPQLLKGFSLYAPECAATIPGGHFLSSVTIYRSELYQLLINIL